MDPLTPKAAKKLRWCRDLVIELRLCLAIGVVDSQCCFPGRPNNDFRRAPYSICTPLTQVDFEKCESTWVLIARIQSRRTLKSLFTNYGQFPKLDVTGSSSSAPNSLSAVRARDAIVFQLEQPVRMIERLAPAGQTHRSELPGALTL